MHAELMMIGTELLLGQIVDTNSAHMAQVLAENGINIYRKTTVGDNKGRIMRALDQALDRGATIICSGGLGPTEDDITRECIAELLGRPLEFREALYEEVLERFSHLRHLVTENNKRQATLPKGAIAIANPRGTAPGLIVEDTRGTIICVPGVPHELKGMMRDSVLPYLRDRFGVSGVLHYRVLKVCGMGESRVDAALADIINGTTNPSIGLLANPEAVRIRVAARAASREEADALISPVATQIEERLSGRIMGYDDDTVETVVGRMLAERGWRIVVGESDTGGMIGQRLVAAEVTAFAGSRVWPMEQGDEASQPEQALDRARQLLLESPDSCVLVLLRHTGAKRSDGVFLSPEGEHRFGIGLYGGGVLQQTRSSVVALEMVRRILAGVPLEE